MNVLSQTWPNLPSVPKFVILIPKYLLPEKAYPTRNLCLLKIIINLHIYEVSFFFSTSYLEIRFCQFGSFNVRCTLFNY